MRTWFARNEALLDVSGAPLAVVHCVVLSEVGGAVVSLSETTVISRLVIVLFVCGRCIVSLILNHSKIKRLVHRTRISRTPLLNFLRFPSA